MDMLYLLMATVGGSILVLQFILMLIGLGSDTSDADSTHGGDAGGEAGGDAGHDAAGNDIHHVAAADHLHHASAAAQHHGPTGPGHHGAGKDSTGTSATWLAGMLSIRAITAAVAFFGLGGLLAGSLDWPSWLQVPVAGVSGFSAMVAVAAVFRLFVAMQSDGTVRIASAIGLPARVHLSIPAKRAGKGKVMLRLNNQLSEYSAVTHDQAIPTGSEVVVVGVQEGPVLEVALAKR